MSHDIGLPPTRVGVNPRWAAVLATVALGASTCLPYAICYQGLRREPPHR